VIKRMICTAVATGIALGLLGSLGAATAQAAQGDPSQWSSVAGDPSQWLSVSGDPSQWSSVAGDPSQW
jgi:hypothetical protein